MIIRSIDAPWEISEFISIDSDAPTYRCQLDQYEISVQINLVLPHLPLRVSSLCINQEGKKEFLFIGSQDNIKIELWLENGIPSRQNDLPSAIMHWIKDEKEYKTEYHWTTFNGLCGRRRKSTKLGRRPYKIIFNNDRYELLYLRRDKMKKERLEPSDPFILLFLESLQNG